MTVQPPNAKVKRKARRDQTRRSQHGLGPPYPRARVGRRAGLGTGVHRCRAAVEKCIGQGVDAVTDEEVQRERVLEGCHGALGLV